MLHPSLLNRGLRERFRSDKDLLFLINFPKLSTSVYCRSHDTNSNLVMVVMFSFRTDTILVEKKEESGSITSLILNRLIPSSKSFKSSTNCSVEVVEV